MGTRNLTAVRYDGAIRVAQYGQWDGYPTGQGETISVFLRTADLNKFKAAVGECSWITEAEHKQYWLDAGAAPDDDFVNMEVSNRFKAAHPELSRDTGAEVLQLIYDGHARKLHNQWDFIKDTLFCEYAYVLDLDKGVVEVYADNYRGGDVGDYQPDEDVPPPVRVMPFEDFAQQGRMAKLEEELNPEED